MSVTGGDQQIVRAEEDVAVRVGDPKAIYSRGAWRA